MPTITHTFARAGHLPNAGLPRAELPDVGVITAAAYPIPVYDADGLPAGRVLAVDVADGTANAQVEWFGAPGNHPLRARYSAVDVQIRDARRTITAAVVAAFTATDPTAPPDTTQPTDAPTPPPEPDNPQVTVDLTLPIAPASTQWDPHAASARMLADATAADGTVDAELLGAGFLYQDPGTDGNSVDDYQFPVADVIDGVLTLVPQAVVQAAHIVDGGGPEVADIPPQDLSDISDVLDLLFIAVSDMVDAGMQATSDPAAEGSQAGVNMGEACSSCGVSAAALTAAATTDLPVADDGVSWDGPAASSRVLKWATRPDGTVDAQALGSAFVWQDPQKDPQTLDAYKLPVADVIDGSLKLVPNAVRAASAALGGARGGVTGMTPAQKKTAQATVKALMSRIRSAKKPPAPSGEVVAAAAELRTRDAAAATYTRHTHPPARYFAPLDLPGPTPVTVTADGEVYGHIGDWKECHRSFTAAGICVPPPRSACDYCEYHVGTVVTADGSQQRVGTFTVGGGHADLALDASAATRHYDQVGSGAAVGVMREDTHGPYFHGALTPYATDAHVYAMMAFPPSGDWREPKPGRGLEMIAVTAVPTPGFGVKAAMTADGSPSALIMQQTRPYSSKTSTVRETADIMAEVVALRNEAVAVLAASIGRTRGDELAALSAAVHR